MTGVARHLVRLITFLIFLKYLTHSKKLLLKFSSIRQDYTQLYGRIMNWILVSSKQLELLSQSEFCNYLSPNILRQQKNLSKLSYINFYRYFSIRRFKININNNYLIYSKKIKVAQKVHRVNLESHFQPQYSIIVQKSFYIRIPIVEVFLLITMQLQFNGIQTI